MSHIGQGSNGEVITASGTKTIWEALPPGPSGAPGASGTPGASNGSTILAADGIVVASTGDQLQMMKTYTFPAASLAVGDQIELEAWGTNDDATENGDVFCYFGGAGGQFIGPSVEGGPGSGGGQWHFKITIAITGAATQKTYSLAHLSNFSAPNSATHRTEEHSATQAISGSIELIMQGANIDGSNDNAVVVRGWKVTHIPVI